MKSSASASAVDILTTNQKEFVSSCNDLKNALKKIRQNNKRVSTKISTSITAQLKVLGKIILSSNWEEPSGSNRRGTSTQSISKGARPSEQRKSVSKVQLLINEKYVIVRNNALEKLHVDAEKKFTKALDSYEKDNIKVEKMLQQLLDKINSFYEEFQKTLTEVHSGNDAAKFRENREKKFVKFKNDVSKIFYNANEKSHKNLENLEKSAQKITDTIHAKKEEIIAKYNKSLLVV